MKKIIALLIGFNLVIIAIVLGLLYMTEIYPFNPGDPLYPVQATAETWRLRITTRGEEQTDMAINLAERRLADVARADTPGKIDSAVLAFDQAIDLAILYVQDLEDSPEHQDLYFPQFNNLLVKSRLVLTALEKNTTTDTIPGILSKIEDLIETAPPIYPDEIIESDYAGPAVIEAAPVSFLGQELDHDVYPLIGKHQAVDCIYCHPSGEYVNTPTECQECHTEIKLAVRGDQTHLGNMSIRQPNARSVTQKLNWLSEGIKCI